MSNTVSLMKELQKFPAIYTFKIIGKGNDNFKNAVKTLFKIEDREVNIAEQPSAGGKYVSFSVTTIILTYEELEKFYSDISKLPDIKFYV